MKYKTINLFGTRISFYSYIETWAILFDLFIRKDYGFEGRAEPFIIDCGANVGLCTLWFKKRYPKAKVLAFEPNPNTFQVLKLNVEQNKLKDVTLVNGALADNEGIDKMYVDRSNPSSWKDSLLFYKWFKGRHKKIDIKLLRLSKFIDKQVDFLKMDIEGSENEVFKEIEKKLPLINQIVFEYHGLFEKRNLKDLREIYTILERNGFKHKVRRKIKTEDGQLFIIYAFNTKLHP